MKIKSQDQAGFHPVDFPETIKLFILENFQERFVISCKILIFWFLYWCSSSACRAVLLIVKYWI